MALPTTREQQAQQTRRKLVDTALELFAREGYDGASIKTLAREAGVAQGLVYHYFPGKEALLWAVLETHSFAPDLQRLVQERREQPAAAMLLEVGRAFDRLLLEKRSLMRLLVREGLTNPEVARLWQRLIHEGSAGLRAHLAERAETGELRTHDPEVVIRMLLFPIILLHVSQLRERWEDLSFISEMVDVLMVGLAPRNAADTPEGERKTAQEER